MKNVIVCKNCGEENPFYKLTCVKCSSYLRSRVPNIDLWHTINNIFESPVKTFEDIIHAEHKNFVILLSIIMSIKFLLISFQIKNALFGKGYSESVLFSNLLTFIVIFFAFLLVLSLILTVLNNILGLHTKFKNNYSILVYSFIPQIAATVILLPVEIALFREYWFTFNPTPLLIKPTVTYFLLAIEGIMVVWSWLLFIFATYAQSKNKIYSLVVGLLLGGSFLALIVYVPFF